MDKMKKVVKQIDKLNKKIIALEASIAINNDDIQTWKELSNCIRITPAMKEFCQYKIDQKKEKNKKLTIKLNCLLTERDILKLDLIDFRAMAK